MQPQPAPHRRSDVADDVPRAGRVVMVAVSGVAVAAWLFLAFAHLHDRFNVNAVSGTLLALADRAQHGVLYPPFFDGQTYGGTRTMPLPILLYSFAISIGGELLAPAKLVDFFAAAALVVLVLGVLRRQGASWALCLGLASTVVTSQVFLLVGTGIRPEALPTALQLAAVALVAFVPRRSATVGAALLCAVAVVAKLSAVWAPAAIVLWLLFANRGRLVLFGAALVAGLVVLLGAFTVASQGRMATNLLGLGGAGLSVIAALKSPLKGIELLAAHAQATLLLVPPLAAGGLFVTREARPSLFKLALVAATGVLLLAMADVGSDYNHLLDIVVLVPIVALEVVQNVARRAADTRLAWAFLTATIVVGSSAALAVNAGSSLAAALGLPGTSQIEMLDPAPLARVLQGSDSVLAEDPYLNLSRGEEPTVVDPFMLIRVEQREPALIEPLLTRIDAREFDAIVLSRDVAAADARDWFSGFAFGLPVLESIRASYHLCHSSGGSFVYLPNERSCSS